MTPPHLPLFAALLLAIATVPALAQPPAQTISASAAARETPEGLAKSMPALARQLIATYREDDPDRRLDALFRLRQVAGDDADALKSIAELRALRGRPDDPQARARNVLYEIYVRARGMQAGGSAFDQAFRKAFEQTLRPLDDRTSALVIRAMVPYSPGISLNVPYDARLADALARLEGKSKLTRDEALDLVRRYQVAQAYRAFAPLVQPLIAADDARRYTILQSLVETSDHAHVCVMTIRPKTATRPLPALLEFTVYADPDLNMSEARRTASNGYAGVVALTRGKGCSSYWPVVPNIHDGADADAVIDWIARQPWNDGRVGMFGGSYDGFTSWAALKHPPKALKAIMPAVTEAPGIDSPSEGGVMLSFSYYWPFYVGDNKALDDRVFNDRARFDRLFHDWYVSGRAWRDLDKIDGVANPVWDLWVAHPGYGAFWQAMIPYEQEFAAVDIPVLTTTGYYDGGEIGALYYLGQHYQYRPHAEHYLVMGPWDHHWGNRGTVDVLGEESDELRGYRIDPVAHMDLGALRYQWFDYVFKGAPRPAILEDKINFEVMGANVWRHVSSIAAMRGPPVRMWLSPQATEAGFHSLAAHRPPAGEVVQTFDLADRSDIDRTPPTTGELVDKAIDSLGAEIFASAPFDKPVELSGLFGGRLAFVTNKKDFDVQITLYKQSADGSYKQLSTWLQRMSYARDRTQRYLLTPGVRQEVDFKNGRATSERFEPGSRLIAMVNLIRIPAAQINYGSGKDVSDETIADAGEPLTIRWSADSYIDLPIGR